MEYFELLGMRYLDLIAITQRNYNVPVKYFIKLIWAPAQFLEHIIVFQRRIYASTPAIFEMEFFVTLANVWNPPTNATKEFILNVAMNFFRCLYFQQKTKDVNLPLTNEKLCLSFWRHKQAKWLL